MRRLSRFIQVITRSFSSGGTSARFQSNLKSVPQVSKLPSDTDWEKGEEFLEDYNPTVNGYCPISIGDTLGSYQIIRKLGWGVYSTVWLAKSQRYIYWP